MRVTRQPKKETERARERVNFLLLNARYHHRLLLLLLLQSTACQTASDESLTMKLREKPEMMNFRVVQRMHSAAS
jgi:hypothetical protein